MTSPDASSSFLFAGLFVSLVFLLGPSVSMTAQIVALAIAVSVLGLPHGAIDAYIARQEGLWLSPSGLAAFTSVYILVALFVIGAWVILPVLSLLVFLIISAWHFGADANAQKFSERWLFGSLVLSLPAFFHPVGVADLYEMLSGHSARNIVSITRAWAPFAALSVIFIICIRSQEQPQRRKDIVTVLGLIAFAWLLPPLVYFAIYFCSLHSPTHFSHVIKLVPESDRRRAVMQTAAFTLLTLIFSGLALSALSGELTLEKSAVQIIFIGLAALTVPHMVLIDGICRSRLDEKP